MSVEHIAAAGNTEIPARLALESLGFELQCNDESAPEEVWVAVGHGLRLSAPSCLELLGLYCMRTQRGANWAASDAEVERTLSTRYPQTS
jgi:hypothetical protein